MERTIEQIKSDLRYENAEGTHTFHMCKCNQRGCRGNKCQICLEEELNGRNKK